MFLIHPIPRQEKYAFLLFELITVIPAELL